MALGLAVLSVVAGGIYLADRLYYAPLREQKRRVEELERRKAELEQIAERLRHTERRAQIVVLDQHRVSDGPPTTRFRFTEIDAEGNPRGMGREFTVTGEEVYFDLLVVKFEDRYIEEGDALRGKALLLFRRVFTNRLKPEDGQPLDPRGNEPEIYAAGDANKSSFERELWGHFWDLANDTRAAEKKGVRVLQGEAPYVRLQPDSVYLLELRSTGEVSLGPVRLRK